MSLEFEDYGKASAGAWETWTVPIHAPDGGNRTKTAPSGGLPIPRPLAVVDYWSANPR